MTSEQYLRRKPLSAVVLAAGKGVRMRSSLPKVLHPLAGLPMIGHVLATLKALAPERLVVVIGANMEAVAAQAAPATIVVQDPPRGTGDAVRCARAALAGVQGTVLVVFGDTPLLTPQTLDRLVLACEEGAAVAVLGFRPTDPAQYGRLKCAADGALEAIVEFKDATPTERAITLCNAGAMAVDAASLFRFIDALTPHNAQNEYYLTDLVALARQAGHAMRVVEADEAEVMGVNSRGELAAAEAQMQQRLRFKALDGGATLIDPATVYFSHDTLLGRDITIGPNVFFGPGVSVADGVTINGFCHIEGATIGAGAIVGPFARLRPGAVLERGVHVGNFVEIKKAVLEPGAKANHLAYIGDARVGARANVGAGTITCNYDGFEKHVTDIGAEAFIGSNATLVAPVKVADGAYVAAGSVITEAVEADAMAFGRARQVTKAGLGKAYRDRRRREKKDKA